MTLADPPLVSTLRSQRRGPGYFVRALGPTAPEQMTTVPAELTTFVRDENDPWRWQSGAGSTQRRRYHMPASAQPLLVSCLIGSAAASRRRFALQHMGAALARLHQVPVDPLLGPPPALRRLERFLTGAVPEHARDRGHSSETVLAVRRAAFLMALRPGLDVDVVDDCRAAVSATSGVFSHGWLGLDKWFVTQGEGIGLVGEDIGVATREHDLGSIVAQLVEYHHLARGLITVTDLERDKAALLTGYGVDINEAQFSQEIRLAITRHIADYAMHTRGPAAEMPRYAQLISSLATTGRNTARR